MFAFTLILALVCMSSVPVQAQSGNVDVSSLISIIEYLTKENGKLVSQLKQLSNCSIVPDTCPDGWKANQEHCYKANATSVDWFEAQRTCSRAGGSLATIPNQKAGVFVQNELGLEPNQTYSIGLVGTNLWETELWWADGTPANERNWANGFPSAVPGGIYNACSYVSQLDGKWRDQFCTDKRKFICSKFA